MTNEETKCESLMIGGMSGHWLCEEKGCLQVGKEYCELCKEYKHLEKENAELKKTNDKLIEEIQTGMIYRSLKNENAELSNSVTELTNSKTELENKVTELEKQIEKMRCCGNCEYRIKKNLEGRIWVELCEKSYFKKNCEEWELAKQFR